MNYQESEKIFNLVKSSKSVLLNCHSHPDLDSLGSATSMYEVLMGLGIEATIFCPSEIIEEYKFVPNSDQIKIGDYENLDFSEYDLMIVMDSASWDRVSGDKKYEVPNNIKIVNIDNHKTNTEFGEINLLKPGIASTCEMLWELFLDWKIKVNRNMATSLLAGIYGDTGSFQYSETSSRTLWIASQLVELGADINVIVFNLYRSIPKENLKLLVGVFEKIKFEDNFIYFAMSYGEYEALGKPENVDVIDMFLSAIKETDFGFRIIEREKGNTSVSFRARTEFDVSRFAERLGGGGHKGAAGANIKGDFYESVEKILQVVRDEIS